MSKIIIRKFDKDNDVGLIYSSYAKGVYYGAYIPKEEPKKEWFCEFHKKVCWQLGTADVSIACLENDPDTIIGYSIIEDGCLEFVYVKEDFRKQGIATLLLKNQKFTEINEENITNVGYAILLKKGEIDGSEGKGLNK